LSQKDTKYEWIRGYSYKKVYHRKIFGDFEMDLENDNFLSDLFLPINFSIQGLRRMREYHMNYLLDFTYAESKILATMAQKLAHIPKEYPLSLKYLDWEFRDKMIALGLAERVEGKRILLTKKFWKLSYNSEES